MSLSRSTLATLRFGYGFRAAGDAPSGPDALLAKLSRPDPYISSPRIATMAERRDWARMNREARVAKKEGAANAAEMIKAANARSSQIVLNDRRWYYLRPLISADSFRERLVAFWEDHFTVEGKSASLKMNQPDLVQTAIRPHITGRFADMLIAVATHPAMLVYLNQSSSFGPNSVGGKYRKRGLNENLAREILELHTLGVDGPYSQTDVRELAELLTGLHLDKRGFFFNPNLAEPGAETVLGRTYGGTGRATLSDIKQVLEDIAVHPNTAQHLARKLVVHFVGKPVNDDHVSAVAAAYIASGGNLLKTTESLVAHDAAWISRLQKARTPFEFQVAVMRALGADKEAVLGMSRKAINWELLAPAAAMGQRLFRAGGPNGYPEDPKFWISPAALSARIKWAFGAVEKLGAKRDPRDVLEICLRDAATPLLTRAVAGAESKPEGLALIFASPVFNRR